jgi:epoxyqueuosine reductase
VKVLLHICCGVCAAGAAEQLIAEGHILHGYFFNPNIHPNEEYERRLEAARSVARRLNFEIESGPYNPEEWFSAAKAFADEPEGGKRCDVCFRLRLLDAHSKMLEIGADAFTTTLTIGPMKSAITVNRIGNEIGGERFLARDFKKKAGFQRANSLAKEWEIHRQHYCGCASSLKEAERRSTG